MSTFSQCCCQLPPMRPRLTLVSWNPDLVGIDPMHSFASSRKLLSVQQQLTRTTAAPPTYVSHEAYHSRPIVSGTTQCEKLTSLVFALRSLILRVVHIFHVLLAIAFPLRLEFAIIALVKLWVGVVLAADLTITRGLCWEAQIVVLAVRMRALKWTGSCRRSSLIV
jgi:hypothetical protein